MTRPAPLGDEQPDGIATCTHGIDPNLCSRPASWHLIWTDDGENALACDEHTEYATTHFEVYDRHPFGGVCCMPGTFIVWSWEQPPGLCQWLIEDEELVVLANAELAEPVTA